MVGEVTGGGLALDGAASEVVCVDCGVVVVSVCVVDTGEDEEDAVLMTMGGGREALRGGGALESAFTRPRFGMPPLFVVAGTEAAGSSGLMLKSCSLSREGRLSPIALRMRTPT